MAKNSNNDKENRAQNDNEFSWSSVRHHDDDGGTHVPDDMEQTPIRPPGRKDYSTGGTDPETPMGGYGMKSRRFFKDV